MPTIISRPATPTFIVSTTTVETPHPVTSIFERSGDVVATLGDYNIGQIGALGASDNDIIVVESGQFIVKPPQIGDEIVSNLSIQSGDILISDGISWGFSQFSGLVDPILTAHSSVTDGVHGLIDEGLGDKFHSDDGGYKAVIFPPAPVASVFGRTGVVVAVGGDYAIAEITGMTTVGSGADKLGADGLYSPVIHPAIPVDSVFGRTGVVIAAVGDYAIADITGLTTAGSPTDKLGADGLYTPITHPTAPVASVFGRIGAVIAAVGDYAIADITGLTTAGSGTDFLGADGLYSPVVHPPDAVDSVYGRTGVVVAANNDYSLPQIDGLIDSGSGDNSLRDDGTYKAAAPRQVVGSAVADSTTIVDGAAHTTIFDFAPLTAFRNNNVLIKIYYQGHNLQGPAQWTAWIQSSAGLTVQQNAYSGGVAQDANGDERFSFAVVLEGIVSAAGNIQIGVRAEMRDHDFSNAATNGKSRLTIELV